MAAIGPQVGSHAPAVAQAERGEVESGPQLALSAEQIADGYVHACASTPRSDLQATLGYALQRDEHAEDLRAFLRELI